MCAEMRLPHPDVELQSTGKVEHDANDESVLDGDLSLRHFDPDLCRGTQSIHILFMPGQKVPAILSCPRQLF